MSSQLVTTLSTLAASAVFAWLFWGRPPWRMPAKGQRGYRRIISFSGGMAVAYVFVHLLPEIGKASAGVARAGEDLRLPGRTDVGIARRQLRLRRRSSAVSGFLAYRTTAGEPTATRGCPGGERWRGH